MSCRIVKSAMAALSLAAAMLLATPAADAETKLRLGGVHSPTSFETKALNRFAELAAEKTGGEVTVSVYPAGQLGSEVSMIENLLLGALDMFANVADWNHHLNKDFAVLSMPFVFSDLEHLKHFQASETYTRMKQQMLQDRKVRVLADNWYRLPRVLVTKEPVKSLADLQGRKLRMPELEVFIKTWEAMGAKPTVIPFAEAYLAMRTGIVDGMESPLSSIYPQKFYQAASYITFTNHGLAPFNVLMSEVSFARLPKAQQDALVQAAKEAGEFYTKTVEAQFVEQKAKMEKEGATFTNIPLDEFVKRAATVAAGFEKQGMWSHGLFEAVQAR